MTGSLARFRAIVQEMPWIEHRDSSERCIAYVPGTHGQCRNPALWQYSPLPGSTAKAGPYCFRHLQIPLYADFDEIDRTQTFIDNWEDQAS